MIRRFILPVLACSLVVGFGSAHRPTPAAAKPSVAEQLLALDKTYTIEFPLEVVVHAPPLPEEIHADLSLTGEIADWHSTFAEACAAGQQSGKRVLLFQLLGTYGEEFC
jgi:hypothetical protein